MSNGIESSRSGLASRLSRLSDSVLSCIEGSCSLILSIIYYRLQLIVRAFRIVRISYEDRYHLFNNYIGCSNV